MRDSSLRSCQSHYRINVYVGRHPTPCAGLDLAHYDSGRFSLLAIPSACTVSLMAIFFVVRDSCTLLINSV